MDEAGDPNGLKYEKYQAAITQFFNMTPIPVTRAPKLKLPSIQLNPVDIYYPTRVEFTSEETISTARVQKYRHSVHYLLKT